MEMRSYPVDVISICTAQGMIRPLRLRLEAQQRHLRMDIEDILEIDEVCRIGMEGFVFRCIAHTEEGSTLLVLRYFTRSHSWSLRPDGLPQSWEKDLS